MKFFDATFATLIIDVISVDNIQMLSIKYDHAHVMKLHVVFFFSMYAPLFLFIRKVRHLSGNLKFSVL
jgi:hypothetical protein